MNSLIHTAINRALSLIFPDNCVGCNKSKDLLCKDCSIRAKKQRRERKSVLFLDKLYYWGIYENKILRSALRRFKYHGTYRLADPFSDMLAELVKPDLYTFKENSLVIPIPAHEKRKSERGYNQAELLAQKFCEKTGLLLYTNILLKTKNTKSQTSLSGIERIFNVKNSFSVSNPELIKNKKIILVDDIITTGATFSEASRVLKEAGALEVAGLVVAK